MGRAMKRAAIYLRVSTQDQTTSNQEHELRQAAEPKDTPAEIIHKLNKEINAALGDPRIKARIAELGATAFPTSPSEFGKFIANETEKWGKVIRAANIRAE
jgi:tripartite-type tricarboxylate transporter receptor subunit TctC